MVDLTHEAATSPGNEGSKILPGLDEIRLAVNAYLLAEKNDGEGGGKASAEDRKRYRLSIQSRYWRAFYSTLSSCLARRRSHLEFTDEERLFLDLGMVDVRLLDGNRSETVSGMVEDLAAPGMSGCFYLTEWFILRHQQLQLEPDISGANEPENLYAMQLREARKRVLARLSDYFTGLPGIPLEVSEAMRSGDLDNAVITAGIEALKDPRRRLFLRRRSLWMLRDQVFAKASARANSAGALRLFDMLNDIYAREWRERFYSFVTSSDTGTVCHLPSRLDNPSVSMGHADIGAIMAAARQIRMQSVLLAAVDKSGAEPVMIGSGPRVTKADLARFLPVAQTFDRELVELPPIVLAPGMGRGMYAWENGYIVIAVRPLTNVEDSLATAFAWWRMVTDRFSGDDGLRKRYEKKFPGGVFQNDFPADYRAWLTRLTKGEAGALSAEKRAFFQEHIGPDVTGPLLPPNLRGVGPQTIIAICRRIEKQIAGGENDVTLHRRLAALYWQQGNPEAAGVQFNIAMQQAPDDGETLFSAGMFMRVQGDSEAANDCFRFGVERSKNSLWGIYCQDALDGLL